MIAPVKFRLDRIPGVRVPSNVIVTSWVPALQVNEMADLTEIHVGIGTVMTAALAGKPVVGVGMQTEQVANLACLVRKALQSSGEVKKSRSEGAGGHSASSARPRRDEQSRGIRQRHGTMGRPKSANLVLQKFGQ